MDKFINRIKTWEEVEKSFGVGHFRADPFLAGAGSEQNAWARIVLIPMWDEINDWNRVPSTGRVPRTLPFARGA